MKARTKEKKRLICAAFAAAALLLAALLWAGLSRGDAVRFGVSRGAGAYGACMLLQTKDAGYRVSRASTDAALYDALTAGQVDAALLPLRMALALPGQEYATEAVLTYTTWIAVSADAGVRGMADLNGRALCVPADAQNTPAHAMLLKLLDAAEAKADIVFCDDAAMAARAQKDVLLVPTDALYAVLSQNEGLSARFSLSAQWKSLIGSVPPADTCLIVRKDYLQGAGGDYAVFLKKLKDSVAYADEKRKKSVAMIVDAGLAQSTEEADAVVAYHPFAFLTGSEAKASLAAYDAVAN